MTRSRYGDALFGIAPKWRGGEERLEEAETVKEETDDRMAVIDEVLGVVATNGANTPPNKNTQPTEPAPKNTESLLSEIDELTQEP